MRLRSYHSSKARSQKSEKAAAAIFSGHLQPASGALKSAHLKGDVKSSRFLVDDKTTLSGRFSLTARFWKKLRTEAFSAHNRHPVIRIVFVADGGANEEVFVISRTLMDKVIANEQGS